jgi:uncharacterized protein (DUF2342 family)
VPFDSVDQTSSALHADVVSETQPILIVRSLLLGIVLGVVAAAALAGVCKLVAPSYDAGDPALMVGLIVIAVTTTVFVRRGDKRAHGLMPD